MKGSDEARRRASAPLSRLAGLSLTCVLLAALALVAAELWLREHIHLPPHPQTHVFLRKPLSRTEVHVLKDVPGLDQRSTVFTTNALGLRGDELDLTDESVLRVVALGGSVTECMVLADEDAWPRRLQDELEQRTQKRVWVGNAGVSGQMTLDYMAHAQLLLPSLRPHVVVIMVGGNDLHGIVAQNYFPIDLANSMLLQRYAAKLYRAPGLGELEPLYTYYLYERWRDPETLDLTDLYVDMKARRFAAKKTDELEDFEDGLDTYRTNLKNLYTALMRLRPAPKVVFMTHPFLWSDKMSEEARRALWGGYTCMRCPSQKFYAEHTLAQSLGRMNQELLRFCASVGLSCFDLEPKVGKTLENFYDDAHLREPGAREVARLVGEFMATQHVLD